MELATAIAISFSRSPMAVANAGWDLNEASGARFVLGLGTQVKAHNDFLATGATDAEVAAVREWVRGRVGFYGSSPA